MASRLKDKGREYQAIHKQVRSSRGLAALQKCVDCTGDASEWSWIHDTDPSDVASYEPRCASCHRLYDLAGVPREASLGLKNAAKLDIGDIPEIRKMISAGQKQVDIAYIYGVDKGVISKIARGIIWKDA